MSSKERSMDFRLESNQTTWKYPHEHFFRQSTDGSGGIESQPSLLGNARPGAAEVYI